MKRIIMTTTAVLIVGVLAGCSKGGNTNTETSAVTEDKATASIKSLLTEQAYQDEMNWCGQQPRPDMIQGCKNAEVAGWLMKDPARLAQIDKPEPWPGKDTAYFQDDLNAQMKKTTPSGAPASNPYAVEKNWCIAQLAYQTGKTPGAFGRFDYSPISTACVAMSKVAIPGGF